MRSEGRRIVAFFEGAAPDDRDRSFEDVLRFDDDALEAVHDFIQWLFPLRDRSGANPSAPRLDDDAVTAFRSRPDLQRRQRRALERMLAFYALRWNGDRIEPDETFGERSHWLRPGNHNHLRLTRMLISLQTLGLEREARALRECLLALAASHPQAISETTVEYWRASTGEKAR